MRTFVGFTSCMHQTRAVCVVRKGLHMVVSRCYDKCLTRPSRSLSLFGWLLNKKTARVEINISLAFLYWVEIALHPWPFIPDIAIYLCWKVTLNTNQLDSSASFTSTELTIRWDGTSVSWPAAYCIYAIQQHGTTASEVVETCTSVLGVWTFYTKFLTLDFEMLHHVVVSWC